MRRQAADTREWRVAGGVGAVALGTFSARGIGFVTSFVAAAAIGASEFGQYALLLAVTTVIASAGGMGLATPLTRSVAAAQTQRDAAAVATGAIHAAARALTLLGVLVLLLCWPAWGLLHPPGAEGELAVVAVAVWVLGTGCNPLFVGTLVGRQRFAASAKLTAIRSVGVALGTVVGCSLAPSAAATAMGSALGELAIAGGAYVIGIRQGWLTKRGRTDLRASRQVMRVGLAAGAAGLAIQISMWVGQVLVSRSVDGLVATGLFLLATRLTLAVTFIPNALATVILPRLTSEQSSQRDPRELSRPYLVATLALACAAAALVGALSVVLAPRLHEEYAAYSSTLVLMAVLAVLIALNNFYGSVVVARGRTTLWVASDFALAAVLLTVALVFVPAYGAAGLAAANLVAFAVSIGVLIQGLRVRRTMARSL
jgi:O-antigen/teichoic acid export membrane protein